MIDLRSDTVTRPTPAMRQVIADAEVGDDVLGDDPTVNALEERTAKLLGKEAAVFVPSGSMSNQIAIRCQTEPGDEIVTESQSHCYYYESGGPAALSGVMCQLIAGQRGIFTADDLRASLRPSNMHLPVTKLVCVENTHNRGGGSIWPFEQLLEVTQVAREAGLKLHLDGARIWNASVATGISEKQYAELFDSVSVCFSKGLGAPVGSALAGSADLIARARRFRKMFGGAMRQAGIIAAGALYALENQRSRLIEDHDNAQALAQGLAGLPGIEFDPQNVETNIVSFKVSKMPAAQFAELLYDKELWVLANGPDNIRAVTHLGINSNDIADAVDIIREALS
ncbi:MAG: low-specificity L-threonine aldolase [Sedimentisphaerales bacterium]|nr:low-specificity L-threonine aldolase [Sedimentisphaerales bacterium]